MYSYGPPHMAKQKQDDQLEPTYSSYVKTQDVTLKTCRRRWMIGISDKRGSGISVLAARHDDDDDDDLTHNRLIGLVNRVLANGPGDLASIPGCIIPKTLKWYLIPPSLTLSNIRYVSRVKYSISEKGVTPSLFLPSRLELQNTPTASLQRGKTPTPTSVLDMTLNNQMVKFQQCWSFGEYGIPLYCHLSQVNSGPEWQHLIRVISMG